MLLSSEAYTVADLEHLLCFGVHLMESLPVSFELCNGEHLATWKAVEPLFWFFHLPHAKSKKCLLIIEFIYPRSLEIKENDMPEFASVFSESWITEKVVPGHSFFALMAPFAMLASLFFGEGRVYSSFYVNFIKMSFVSLLTLCHIL